MVLSNNHLGGLSKVTSYQSQSVCFLSLSLSLFFFYSFLSVFAVPAQSLPSLSGFAAAGSGLALHGRSRRRGCSSFTGCNYRLGLKHRLRPCCYHIFSHSNPSADCGGVERTENNTEAEKPGDVK